MNDQDLTRHLPAELLEAYVPIALLREGDGTQTVLVQERKSGMKAVLKRSLHEDDFSEEKCRLLMELDAEDVAKVYCALRSDGASYLLQEYIPGESLLDYMQKRGPLPAEETAEIGIAVCRALEKLHSLNPPLIHRDIKADNIIRTAEGAYVLTDFGISRLYESSKNRDSRILGTTFSAPPEQFGYQQTDPRSDIYALGVLLHELATGEYLLGKGQLPASLRHVVRRCTRFDPADRYPSAAEVEKALKRVIAGIRAGRRKSRLIAGGLLAALVLGTALLPAVRSGRREILPSDHYSFASSAIEAEVCRQLGKDPDAVTYSDLEEIDKLFLCGDTPFEQWDQMLIHGTAIDLGYGTMEEQGAVDTLADIPNLPNLRELALCNQQLTDLSSLSGCKLEQLALHGNQIEDISPLAGCEQLQQLDISDNPVSDVTPLAVCSKLWRLNVGATHLTDVADLAEIHSLVYLEVHDCVNPLDLTALDRLGGLRYLSVRPVNRAQLDTIGSLVSLEHLYIWSPNAIPDLTPLAGLTSLQRLYVDMPGLRSLAGAEGFTWLEFLDVRGCMDIDITPLLGLTHIKELNVGALQGEDWTVLDAFPELSCVHCSSGQEPAIRLALAGRAEIWVDAP